MRTLPFACLFLSTLAFAAEPKKVVLIAGPLDKSHPPGTHEYEKTVRVLKYCLEHAENVMNLRLEAHFGGWPEKPETLDDADTIVLVASGSDRKETDHPFLVGDRLSVIEKQMKRGCGLCLIHWCTFWPKEKAGDKVLDWVGGYFDYESGPAKNGWYSKIQTVTVKCTPVKHPITTGMDSFEAKDEFYYKIRFRERDPRLVPILNTAIEGGQVVAWAVERKDGGRGFGFTGGHFFDNWKNENYRKMALNAILWTAKAPIPEGGVKSEFPPDSALGIAKSVERRLTFADGKFGKALDARVLPARIEGDDRYRTPPITVECWAKLFSKTGFNVLVSCDPKSSAKHWEIYSYAGKGDFSAYLPGTVQGEIRSGVDICDSKWHHVAMTHDGKKVMLFVDGKNVKESPLTFRTDATPQAGPLEIGAAYDADHRIGCDGLIDDVRISKGVIDIKVPMAALKRDENTLSLWNLDGDEGISADVNWTPPTPIGAKEPWEVATDKDWIDGRFRKMDTGPFLNATIDYEGPKGKVRSYKATAIKVGDNGEATVLFDRNQLSFAAAWTGGFLNHSDRRFGLLNTPTPNGTMVFSTSSLAGWADEKGNFESKAPPTAPLPKEWGRFIGTYLKGDQTVLSYLVGRTEVRESMVLTRSPKRVGLTRVFEIGPCDRELKALVLEPPAGAELSSKDGVVEIGIAADAQKFRAVTHGPGTLDIDHNKRVILSFPASREFRRVTLIVSHGDASYLVTIANLRSIMAEGQNWTKPGPARWTKPITTRLEPGKDTGGPFVVDAFPLPYDNPYNALFFVTGVDFLPDGRIAICTAHGDVWTAKEKSGVIEWRRFATGLYQPLGLKVVDGKIIVTERGQLTRLHDTNNDGEADFYECLNNDWHTGGGEHSYDTCLETDPEGNFYLFKTGDDHTPTGGCLLKISKDGSKSEIFATGFRHPIGLGVSPDGKVYGADQEGNWMPVTRIDQYKKGGFYGDMRTHHRDVPPKIYDEPLLWLPKEADNSAGGQVWVPKGEWGDLSGRMLHLSYGRCKAYAILPDGDKFQAGAVDLGLTFLSGSARARFNPVDKQMYVVGLMGWQTAAKRDGCLQRVRYTGKPYPFPVTFSVHARGVNLTFDQPLDAKSASDLSKYKVGRCNYRWSGEYGSKNWSVLDPNKEGIDDVPVTAAKLSDDGKTVTLKCDIRPAMHMKIAYDLQSANGAKLAGAVFTTIHK
jgi:type 1 glutamine amidotransferase